MNINDKLVRSYLENTLNIEEDACWIYSKIKEGDYLFETPNANEQDDVKALLINFHEILLDFKPFNQSLFEALFPEWRHLLEEVNIILAVGCPDPYDAFVRKNKEKEYIIFDLLRFNVYRKLGYDIELAIRQMITHEFVHICLHNAYPQPTDATYVEALEYILFDEGFAHLLAFKEDVLGFDFSEYIETKMYTVQSRFKQALLETDVHKQKMFLEEANAGSYWDKFAAISGKLYLAKNKDRLNELYGLGVKQLTAHIMLEDK